MSNEVGGGLVSNAVWTGVPLATLLDMAGVEDGADQIVGRSVDDWTGGFPTEVALTNETPLENGVQYQASVIRTLEDGNVACGCVRFNAGTSASDDDNCL